ncbi:MAG: NAD-dependent epimerase/dehydratase family protein, partial [Clostridia bacterium]|nr:NAD-dependent epimerase/dehydratase family protein [Clostridia bacterium]
MYKIVVTGAKGKLSCKTADWLKSKGEYSVKQLSLRENWQDYDFTGTYAIVHIAGITPQNAKDDSDYKKINTLLTEMLAKKAKAQGVKYFVFISTMAVYGITQSINSSNGCIFNTSVPQPTTEYGRSKFNAEKCLKSLEDSQFKICIIRVPSIYDKDKTEYMDQYKYLADKYPFIPKCFAKNYKSFIHLDNLCELIYLAIVSNYTGIICPDDGKFSAFDICACIYPNKPKLRFAGKLIELFMKNNPRIIDYYGAIYYSD